MKRGSGYAQKAKVTAKLYEEEYGTHTYAQVSRIKDEADAKAVYEQLRENIYPTYSQWAGAVKQAKR